MWSTDIERNRVEFDFNWIKVKCDLLATTIVKDKNLEYIDTYELVQSFFAEHLSLDKSPALMQPTISFLKLLIANGGDFDEFCTAVRQYDNAVTCGLVWTPNFIAYRCRTCGLSPCMSMCSDCFLSGEHDGHDFNMFRSQAGGACDCGDINVMKESGFCKNHGPNAKRTKIDVPRELLSVPEFMLPKLFRWLLVSYRRKYQPDDSSPSLNARKNGVSHTPNYDVVVLECDPVLKLLQDLSDCGAATQRLISKYMLDSKLYFDLLRDDKNLDNIKDSKFIHSLADYNVAIGSLKNLTSGTFSENEDIDSTSDALLHESILEELVFWLVRFGFPQTLVSFLLSMLPVDSYKIAFADSFIRHYGQTAALFPFTRMDKDNLPNRVIHISVQLLSNEQLAFRLVQQQNLLSVIATCLLHTIELTQAPSIMHTNTPNKHSIIDCTHPIISDNNYWALVSDMHNLLSHKCIAQYFMRDPHLVDLWFHLLQFFQGMNLNERMLVRHVEYESRTYYEAFTAELECSAGTMWSLLNHCSDESMHDCLLMILQAAGNAIQEWFEAINFTPDSCWNPPRLLLTFHIPLHRFYAAFMCHALKQNCSVLFLSELSMRQIFIHPLLVQVGKAEVAAGMWVRNGVGMRYQTFFYNQSHFCSGFVDLDLFLMQTVELHSSKLCWAGLPSCILRGIFILGMTRQEIARLEVATVLIVSDRKHSEVQESLPDRGHTEKQPGFPDLEEILRELADYKAPQMQADGSSSQGTYTPKDVVWDEYFDPIFVMIRVMQMKEFQTAMGRYTDYLRRSKRWDEKTTPWPPFRMPKKILPVFEPLRRLLHCRSLHGILFYILNKAISEPGSVSEQSLYLSIYLLDLALQLPAPTQTRTLDPDRSRNIVLDLQFCGWFSGNDLYVNLLHKIDKVLVVHNVPGLSRAIDDGTSIRFPDLWRLNVKFSPFYQDFFAQQMVSQHHQKVSSTTGEDSGSGALVPRSTSGDIPYIDTVDSDQEGEADTFYQKVIRTLPPSVIRPHLPSSEVLKSITNDPGSDHRDQSSALVVLSPVANSAVEISTTSLSRTQSCEGNTEDGPYVDDSSVDSSSDSQASETTTAASAKSRSMALVSRRLQGVAALQQIYRHFWIVFDKFSSSSSRQVQVHNKELAGMEEQKALPESSRPPEALLASHIEAISIEHSMLTLLLKLYERFAQQSYSCPPVMGPPLSRSSCVIGAGAVQIKAVLDRIYSQSQSGRAELEKLIGKPRTGFESKTGTAASMDGNKSPASVQRESKKKLARERQQRLMAQFSNQQKVVMEKLLKAEREAEEAKKTENGDADQSSKPIGVFERRLSVTGDLIEECVICSQPSEANLQRPLCLVVLIHPSAIIGKCCPQDSLTDTESRPYDLLDVFKFKKDLHMRSQCEMFKRHTLGRTFDPISAVHSTDFCWNSSAKLLTCGHFVHQDCHLSYMQALKRDYLNSLFNNFLSTIQSFNPEKGEFQCPLCRQHANATLPLLPVRLIGGHRPPSSAYEGVLTQAHFTACVPDIAQSLEKPVALSEEDGELFGRASNPVMQQLISCLPMVFSGSWHDSESPIMLLSSLLRFNIELENIERSAGCFNSRRSCLNELMRFVMVEASAFSEPEPGFYRLMWSNLTGDSLLGDHRSINASERMVPLLLKDCRTLLLQLTIILMRSTRDSVHLRSLIHGLFNVQFIQSCLKAFCLGSRQDLENWSREASVYCVDKGLDDPSIPMVLISSLLREVLSKNYLSNVMPDQSIVGKPLSVILALIKRYSVPFLTFATCLKSIFYPGLIDVPLTTNFDKLSAICFGHNEVSELNMLDRNLLYWISCDATGLVNGSWLPQLFASQYALTQDFIKLIMHPTVWRTPKLLNLPESYDKLFQMCHKAVCLKCKTTPTMPLLCLICGRVVCFKHTCCNDGGLTEPEFHSCNCCGSYGVYLSILGSTILVVRQRRIAVWGSVYLDSHGEEDQGLKRGKPLFLSKERFGVVERLWLSHSFDAACKRWDWLTVPTASAIPL